MKAWYDSQPTEQERDRREIERKKRREINVQKRDAEWRRMIVEMRKSRKTEKHRM